MRRRIFLAVFGIIFCLSMFGVMSGTQRDHRDKSLNVELYQIVTQEDEKISDVNLQNVSLALGLDVKRDYKLKEPTIKKEKPAISDKFIELYARNSDFVGWIDNGDFLNYPIVQNVEDENFYLHRNFDRQESNAGTLYIPSDCSLDSSGGICPIYGHNMKNGTMFGDLDKYLSRDYFNAHKTIKINTLFGEGRYEVIGVFKSQVYDSSYTGFKYYNYKGDITEEEFAEYIAGVSTLLAVGDVSDLRYGDKIVELVTCAYHVDNGRLIVLCRKLK